MTAEWKTIDSAPMGKWVLVWDGGDRHVARREGDSWSRKGDDYDLAVYPTHWMPLPSPPNQEGKEK